MIKLKEMRKARGLTQAQLAEKVKRVDPTADQTMISVLERGELYPGEKLRDALCAALDCTEAELYDGVEAFFVPAEDKEFSDLTVYMRILLDACGTITREELASVLKTSDRKARKIVEMARDEGLIIANRQDGKGYFLPKTVEDLKALYNMNQSRAIAILRQQKHIRRAIREHLQESE